METFPLAEPRPLPDTGLISSLPLQHTHTQTGGSHTFPGESPHPPRPPCWGCWRLVSGVRFQEGPPAEGPAGASLLVTSHFRQVCGRVSRTSSCQGADGTGKEKGRRCLTWASPLTEGLQAGRSVSHTYLQGLLPTGDLQRCHQVPNLSHKLAQDVFLTTNGTALVPNLSGSPNPPPTV